LPTPCWRWPNKGYDAFYQGDIARQIATCVQAAGGFLTEDDLANYRAEWVEPLSLDYRDGYTFHEIPPNGQGLTALLALNLVKTTDLAASGYGSPETTHRLIEAIKLAFADAQAYIGDPRQTAVPVEGLLSERYAAQRRALIGDTALQPQRVIRPAMATPFT
jgi:gamma-glutamyltranspeptidase / glutathione hydrolase